MAITEKYALKCYCEKIPVYIVRSKAFEYFVDKVFIIGVVSSLPDTVLEFYYYSKFFCEEHLAGAYEFYETYDEAEKACAKSQKEYGYVVISQSEYDRLKIIDEEWTTKRFTEIVEKDKTHYV